ncbi:MAG TPA: GHKL domain-containing protein [Clostridiales bacterium]|nr:GHKL domain-containing protein [Clostridiales bacterium]
MKKAIFRRFVLIIALAIILSCGIFGVAIGNIILARSEESMLYTVRIADHGLDYNGDLKAQVDLLRNVKGNESTRFTIIDMDGDVIADSNVENSAVMENHLDREEVQEALRSGLGYAIRKSETLNYSMLYVASMSESGDYILRIAVPFSGMEQYIGILVPAILASISITLIVSLILANRFSRSVTSPLLEIADEMRKLKDKNPEFHFNRYQYDEMNVIADTTLQMSKAVEESMDRIEFEKLIRQEFFSNASHELKTPLTSIRGYIELLQNGMAADEGMKKEFLSRIKLEADNMTNLINDILMISRLETKEAEVVRSEVRISPLLQEVCRTLRPLAQEYQVELKTSCRPLSMTANMQQLRELLSNLINNAIKYNKPGGKVEITVTSEAQEMVVTVADTGVGIAQEDLQRIFERFYRVDKGRSKKVGGTGLGLSIVKHIVNYYDGSIQVESKLGEGTKFTVRLPLKREALE